MGQLALTTILSPLLYKGEERRLENSVDSAFIRQKPIITSTIGLHGLIRRQSMLCVVVSEQKEWRSSARQPIVPAS